MLKKLIKAYKKILDEKIENGAFMVLIIAGLIVIVSTIINNSNINF